MPCPILILAVALARGVEEDIAVATSPSTPLAVEIITDPRGADVWVDGTWHGESPLLIDALEPGIHRLRVVRTGRVSGAGRLDVKTDGARYEIQLPPFPRDLVSVEAQFTQIRRDINDWGKETWASLAWLHRFETAGLPWWTGFLLGAGLDWGTEIQGNSDSRCFHAGVESTFEPLHWPIALPGLRASWMREVGLRLSGRVGQLGLCFDQGLEDTWMDIVGLAPQIRVGPVVLSARYAIGAHFGPDLTSVTRKDMPQVTFSAGVVMPRTGRD